MRTLTPRQILKYSMISILFIEAITLVFRYVLHQESNVATATSVGWLTGGIRIHHGFFGVVLLFLAGVLRSRQPLFVPWVIVLGNGLLFSDLIHHLIIWPEVGYFLGPDNFSLFYSHSDELRDTAPQQRLLSWTALLYVAEWAVRIIMLVVILMKPNQSSVTAVTWLLVISFLPWLGLILYWVFGQSRLPPWREQRLARLPRALEPVGDRLSEHCDVGIWEPHLPDNLEPAVELATNLAHLPIMGGNTVELWNDYNGTLDRLARDIDDARHHVHLLFYIFAVDAATERILAALERAVARGVICRILVDAFGSKRALKALLPRLAKAGVQAHVVLPAGLFQPRSARIDMRNHRKIAVIDGRTGYTGSQNLVDAVYKEGITYEELMTRVCGPVVLQLQYVFVADWYLETEQLLDDQAFFPDPELCGGVPAQVLPAGPGYPNLQRLLVALLYEARERVVITTPYFIPDEPLIQAMATAVLRGVEVHLIVSKKMDQWLVGFAQRSYYDELLEAGIHIHVHRGKFLHAKHVSFDSSFAMIGSTNMDIRSFRLNAEVALLVYDPGVAAKLHEVEDRYLRHCQTLTREFWGKRRFTTRLVQNLARLFSPLL